jgi:hypothetical protein
MDIKLPIINKKLCAFRNPRIYITNRGAVMDKVIPLFFRTNLKKAKAALLFQDVMGNGLKYAVSAKQYGIPVVVVQHGKNAIRDYLPPYNHELLADKLCVWGPKDKEMLISKGIPKEKIEVVGCPLFEGVNKERTAHKGINVVFAPAHYEKEIVENIKTMETLKAIKNINVTAKILSVHKKEYYGKNYVISNSFDDDHIAKCIKLLRKTDIVVVNEFGTFQLLAAYLGIPVIFIDNIKKMPVRDTIMDRDSVDILGAYRIERTEQLYEAIEMLSKDPSKTKKDREEELIQYGGTGLEGSPSVRIMKVILNLIDMKRRKH